MYPGIQYGVCLAVFFLGGNYYEVWQFVSSVRWSSGHHYIFIRIVSRRLGRQGAVCRYRYPERQGHHR